MYQNSLQRRVRIASQLGNRVILTAVFSVFLVDQSQSNLGELQFTHECIPDFNIPD